MSLKGKTFGRAVSELRAGSGLNQRELASKIRKEDGKPISQQYLNDIENDRRSPTNEHLIKEMAKALSADPAYLIWLSGQIPPELRDAVRRPEDLSRLIELAKRARR